MCDLGKITADPNGSFYHPDDVHALETTLVSLENTMNKGWSEVFTPWMRSSPNVMTLQTLVKGLNTSSLTECKDCFLNAPSRKLAKIQQTAVPFRDQFSLQFPSCLSQRA